MRKCTTIALAVAACGLSAANSFGYVLNSSDFATEVVAYTPGVGVTRDLFSGQLFDNPLNALGRPTVDTTGDGMSMPLSQAVPLVPIYGAFRAHELVTIGQGGQLIVKFDRPVMDDPNNPHGLDLLIFGNAAGAGTGYWANGDPNQMRLSTGLREEPGLVSVSQDGENWYTFAQGPFADDFAPTLGRVYDPDNPQVGPWWGQPTDPTRPLDPALAAQALVGQTIAEIAQLYGQSAGGTGFDIGMLGLPWIQYVRIENPDGSGLTPDIDAFADVTPVPEPTWMGLCIGAAMLLKRRSRR